MQDCLQPSAPRSAAMMETSVCGSCKEKEEEEKYKGVERKHRQQQSYWLSVWLHYYYDIYLIKTKEEQSVRFLPTQPFLHPKLVEEDAIPSNRDNILESRILSMLLGILLT